MAEQTACSVQESGGCGLVREASQSVYNPSQALHRILHNHKLWLVTQLC